jgi:hypothetical protein
METERKVIVCLVVILGLYSLGISGVLGLAQVEAPVISLDNGTGVANASICVANHSRLVYAWCDQNASNDTRVELGKDGQYIEFGADECAYLVMGISPCWNQTVEIYVHSNTSIQFDIWGTIVPGSVWRAGEWVVDNPDQPDQDVVLATIIPDTTEQAEDLGA